MGGISSTNQKIGLTEAQLERLERPLRQMAGQLGKLLKLYEASLPSDVRARIEKEKKESLQRIRRST